MPPLSSWSAENRAQALSTKRAVDADLLKQKIDAILALPDAYEETYKEELPSDRPGNGGHFGGMGVITETKKDIRSLSELRDWVVKVSEEIENQRKRPNSSRALWNSDWEEKLQTASNAFDSWRDQLLSKLIREHPQGQTAFGFPEGLEDESQVSRQAAQITTDRWAATDWS